jgi:Ca2+-transporting ATPase
MLQLLNWKQRQSGIELNPSSISPQIRAYSEQAGKWGMIAAGITWVITRSPLRGLAVLLAANPRPATMTGEFAWNQAELMAKE